MAISRSLMNRQLQANGGIMQVTPRENFGLGSKIKKFVRKIIPNEVADIAVKAAPFVAPFNPALAGAMAGIGSFDQTGSIGDSLKRGALTYGGGQAARYIGGAGFQGNPFASGGAFTPTGFTSGFSFPIGTETGLGKFFSNRGTAPVEGVDYVTADAEPVKSSITETFATADSEPVASKLLETSVTTDAAPVASSLTKETVVNNNPGFIKTVTEGFKNKDFSQIGNAVLDQTKKFGKAMFTKTDAKGNTVIDKAAVMGAVAFTASYVEAKALAADVGVDLTEEEYDEAKKAEKKEEYANYLTNFFAGKKDGGRIGFSEGADLEQKLKDLANYYMERGLSESEAYETAAKELYKADGGRIGFKKGSPEEPSEIGIMSIDVEAGDDDEENMDDLMAGITFSSAEKSYLFRRLAGGGGSSRSYTMPNLYRILSNPNRYPSDAAILKEIAIMGMKADGGRIGFKDGTPDNTLEEILATDMTISNNPNDPRNMTTEEIIAVINSGRSTPELFEELLLRNTGGVNEIDMDEGQAFSFNERGATSDGAIENLLFKLRESNPDIYGDYNRPRKFLPTAEPKFYAKEPRADGGRIGFAGGSGASDRIAQLILTRDFLLSKDEDVSYIDAELRSLGYKMKSEGGVMDVKIPTGEIRKNNAGVVERDYRDEGGFVPVGVKEKADDVPAMLSKNEFVMTADAVRGIGGGDVEEGSKKLYNTMKQAEQVGKA